MAKKRKIKLLELTPQVFEDYRKSTANNADITYELACKKFTRNMLLAHEAFDPYSESRDNGILYKYGYTQFIVKNRKVVSFKPYGKYPSGWMKDPVRYNELNEILGIS